jgi:hypothetical protein
MTENEEDRVYLSAKDIRQWKDEYAALIAERMALANEFTDLQKRQTDVGNRIAALGQRLRQAVPFSPELAAWLEDQDFNLPENVALTDAILKSLLRTHLNAPMQRQAIQQMVPQLGYPAQKLQSNPNYLYIALKRLSDRNLIVEAPPHHFRLTDQGRAEASKR